jgi:hypothetical protein
MTAIGPTLPGSRALQAWWAELSGLQPRRLWIATLLYLRVEALAVVSRTHSLDPFQRGLLIQLAASVPVEVLHLDAPVLAALLRSLANAGLIAEGPVLTEAGRQALAAGSFPAVGHERRVFWFVERPGEPPAYLHLLRIPVSEARSGAAAAAPTPVSFDPACLVECVRRDQAWKARAGFPADVIEICAGAGDWRHVVLVQPLVLSAVLLEAAARQGSALLGCAVTPAGGLDGGGPVFEREDDWREVFPDLADELPAEVWQEAFRAWLRQKRLPPELNDAAVQPSGTVLEVSVPAGLRDRGRLPADEWLLAGGGRAWRAARIEWRN